MGNYFLRLKKERFLPVLITLAFLLLFGTIFLRFLSIPLWDCDFWYHISTGRQMVETGSLLERDPFSYTTNLKENEDPFPNWENSVLKHYWLSQVILFLVYNNAGPKGIIILRSLLLTMTIFIVFWRLQRWSVSPPITFIFIFSLFTLLLIGTGERPVLFTILFTAISIFILEDFKSKRDNRILLLSPLMLLWANLHGGFIIGAVVIMAFMFGEGAEIILKRKVYARREIIKFYGGTIAALVLSYINPTGWDAFSFALAPKYAVFFEGTQEYHSPFYFFTHKLHPINYGYIFLAVSFPVILMLRNRRLEISHLILLIGTFVMGVNSIRYTFYYGIITSMVVGRETDKLFKKLIERKFSETTRRKILYALNVAILSSAILFAAGYYSNVKANFNVAYGDSVPKRAVDFIEKNKLSGNMFNEYTFGGYITWRLYPWKKNFIDTRTLNYTVLSEFGWIKAAFEPGNFPLWEKLLAQYKVNFMILYLVERYGGIAPLIFKLVEDDKWVPVYCDPMSVIFVKNSEENNSVIEKYKLSRDDIYNAIIYRSSKIVASHPPSPIPFLGLGETFHKMGRLDDSLKAYKYALERKPDPAVQEKVKQIESEINKKKGL